MFRITFSPALQFARNCRLCFRLLLTAPREFLYSFTYSATKKTKLHTFDPDTKRMGVSIVRELKRLLPESSVRFFGSANLEIDGMNDIDIFVATPLKSFAQTTTILKEKYGNPTKVRPFRLEWIKRIDGYPVEIILLTSHDAQFQDQVVIYEALESDRKLLAEYVALKESLVGESERTYHRNRILFFEAILERHKSARHSALGIVLTALFVLVILGLTVRGIAGNPTSDALNDMMWKDEGPLELSPDRGRFALMYSLLEDRSFHFSIPVAKFAAPDVAFSNGNFVSLFAPTVSYIIMPGYLLGKAIGLSQVGSFAIIAIFAFCNFLLIHAIARRLGASRAAAILGGLLFVFASPGFAYAVTLYQHHISTFLILSSIYILLTKKNVWWYSIIWFFCALSISVDNPNVFLMAPIGLFALGRVISIRERIQSLELSIRWAGLFTMVVMVLPIMFFLYFNKMSYGNAFQLAGTVASGDHVSKLGVTDLPTQLRDERPPVGELPAQARKKSAVGFFKPRQIPHGMYEHLLSWDRGMIFYTPVLLLGILGAYLMTRKNGAIMGLLTAVIGVNLLLYSMWGDPYGGWAFGSRYMIPSYALLAIFLAYALSVWRRKILFLALVLIAAVYSVGVNTIGALTSNRNPPQVEILAMEAISGREEKYTVARNMQMLDSNRSKSFVFSLPAVRSQLTAWEYATGIGIAISAVLFIAIINLRFGRDEAEETV